MLYEIALQTHKYLSPPLSLCLTHIDTHLYRVIRNSTYKFLGEGENTKTKQNYIEMYDLKR